MHPDFKKFVLEMFDQSDQACVLIVAAKLDYVLGEILRKILYPNSTSKDDLLDTEGPLSSFSAKINFCHRLGVIDPEFAKALHLLRKIRNAFAHESSGCSLSSGSHRDRAKELARPFHQRSDFRNISAKMAEQKKMPDEVIIDFKLALGWMCAVAHIILDEVKPIYQQPAWNYLADWNRELPGEVKKEK